MRGIRVSALSPVDGSFLDLYATEGRNVLIPLELSRFLESIDLRYESRHSAYNRFVSCSGIIPLPSYDEFCNFYAIHGLMNFAIKHKSAIDSMEAKLNDPAFASEHGMLRSHIQTQERSLKEILEKIAKLSARNIERESPKKIEHHHTTNPNHVIDIMNSSRGDDSD